jgi:hypothetical protein
LEIALNLDLDLDVLFGNSYVSLVRNMGERMER